MKRKESGRPDPKVSIEVPALWPLEMPVRSRTDPLGSYTGVPADPNEMPVQDADDL